MLSQQSARIGPARPFPKCLDADVLSQQNVNGPHLLDRPLTQETIGMC